MPLTALILCLLAGLSWGTGNVVSRAVKAPGGLAHLGWNGVLATAYTAGLCSLVGYAVFNRLLSRYPSGHVVPWVLLAPVTAMAASWALLGENPGPAELAGAVLLVTGVLTAQGTIRLPRADKPSGELADGEPVSAYLPS